MVSSETLYLILTGTISAITAWIIINAIKYIFRLVAEFVSNIKQMKRDMEELKIKVKNLEDKTGDRK